MLLIIPLLLAFEGISQIRSIEFGLGAKYDKFNIAQSSQALRQNLDPGAIGYFSFSQSMKKEMFWEAGFATNNYKINFRLKGPDNTIYSNRELVSVMQSNRIFFNIKHQTKSLNKRLIWTNSLGISLIIGAKNPYDVVLERGRTLETDSGAKVVDIKIKTFGLTGSAILLGLNTRLYYAINEEFDFVTNVGLVSGLSKVSKIEVDYVFGSSTHYKKAILTTNGFAPMLSIGIQYHWLKE